MQINGNFSLNAGLFQQIVSNTELKPLTKEGIIEANKRAESQKALAAISQSEALERRIIAQKREMANAILGSSGSVGYSSYGSM